MSESAENIAKDILVKLGQVFCRVGDAVFKDFTESCLGKDATWADFKKQLDKDGINAFEKFVNHIIKNLGYDISHCESGELYELVKSVIIKSKTIGESIKDLIDKGGEFNLDSLLCVDVVDQNDANKDHVLSLGDVIDLTNLPVDVGEDNKSKGIVVGGELKAIFDLVTEIVDLIKKIADFEWKKLADDCKDFGKFIKDKYINEDFGRRVLDYILILLLKNARDVFADDVKYIINKYSADIEKFIAEKVNETVAQKVMKEIRGYIDSITIIEDTIKDLEDDAAKRAEAANKALKKAAESTPALENASSDGAENGEQTSTESDSATEKPAKEPSVQLQSALNVCKDKLNKLLEEYLPSYNVLAKIFERTYAILDLCGIVGEKSINLVEVGFVKDANNAISDKTSVDLIDLAADKVGMTIQIPVFHWELVEKMFTKPKDYLKDAFPLNDVEDVEKLAAKIATVIRSFNSDFPEFKNAKQFILDIINRIDDSIEHVANVNVLKEFRSFLIDLLKVLERYAYEAKNTLQKAFVEFKKDAKSEGKNLISQLSKDVNAVVREVKSVDLGNAEILQTIFLDTFKDAAKNVITEKYAGKSVEDALHLKLDELTKPFDTCKGELKTLATTIQSDFKKSFDPEEWKKRFKKLANDLETEFNKQTKDVPKSLDELGNFACQSLSDLVNGKKLKNPLSNFDPSAYFKIIGDAFSGAITIDFGGYITTFKNAIRTFFNDFCEGLKNNIAGLAELGDDIQNLATDLLSAWLEGIKQKIYELVVRPYIQAAKKAIKKWAANVIAQIISEVRSAAVEIAKTDADLVNGILNPEKEIKVVQKKAEEAVDAIMDLLTLIQTVKEGAGNVNSLGDGIQFAIKLYRAIPTKVKDYVSELIDLPDIDLSNVRLPEYTLDVENKFFAVTLWKYQYENKSANTQTADVLIQLAVFVGEYGEGDEKTEGLYICPIVKGNYKGAFNLGKNHRMELGANASVNKDVQAVSDKNEEIQKKLSQGKIGFFINRASDKFSVRIKPIGDTSALSAYLELWFKRGAVGDNNPDPVKLIQSNVVDLSIANYPQKIFAGYSDGAFDVGFLASLEGLKLALKLKQLNGFFDAVLGGDVNIDIGKLAVSYSLKDGLKIEDKAHVKIPFNSNIDLKVVKFKNLTLDVGLENGDLEAGLMTTFIADLKCAAFTFTDLGFGVKWNLFTPDGKAGTLKADPKIYYPSGIGISIDASAVNGSGGIQWDEEKQRFAGAIELNVLEKFGVNAMLVFTTGKGTDPFSFMGALSVTFNPGIQVGMGFSITAIGGSLGLNRGLDVDNLRAAVYDGSLSSILFVKDIKKDFDKVLANVDKYYPIIEEQMYVGLLAQITWGTILTADFGLFIQAPSPVTIIAAGVVKVRLADSAEKYLAINADFIGGIQFDKGIFFDASLFDSKIVGISIYGDMALRIYWGGDTKGFILSIGGFHPQYKPESGFNLVNMKRVGMKLDFDVVNMSLEAYFAITSNTVQFGAAFDMKIGWDKFGLTGNAAFNVLFQFKPFYFMADMSVGLAVKLGSVTLCSISLSFDLSGPARWHAKGKAHICVLFFDVGVDFSCTWGKDQNESDKKYIDVFLLYSEAVADNSNWKLISTDYSDNMVKMMERRDEELVVLPSDLISFNQSVVPFERNMNCYGENEISDYSRLEISDIKFGCKSLDKDQYELDKASFAPTLTQKMDDDDKLKSPSYVYETSGFKLYAGLGSEEGSTITGNIACEEFEDVSNISASDVDELMAKWRANA
ncbi:DUF6603 domain-containing protein [Fibrobacter succinogenes]|uniref:DUF6603 domain-containing protein n=1 Tax=Fibrobacter succinogenes TaxID=833 RepID=UPI0002F878D7|nr:DUF6603 domain-containing protein [Fibrobacter succinogenes]